MDDEIKEGLKQWSNNTIEKLLQSLRECASLVEEESINRCPMDTGELRRNHTVIENGLIMTIAYETEVPPEQRYGLLVHECPDSHARYTYNIAHHIYRKGNPNKGTPWDIGEDHFLRNALYAKKQEIIDIISDTMKECCNKTE